MKRLFKLVLLAGIVFGMAKLVQQKKAEWSGLTESEVRDKLQSMLASKMPGEKLAETQDTVVAKMRSRGLLSEEPAATA